MRLDRFLHLDWLAAGLGALRLRALHDPWALCLWCGAVRHARRRRGLARRRRSYRWPITPSGVQRGVRKGHGRRSLTGRGRQLKIAGERGIHLGR